MIAVVEDGARTRRPDREAQGRTAGFGRRDQPLTALTGSALADRFRTWRGHSGRRYIFSVFRLEGGLDHLPVEGGAVAIAAVRQADGTRRKLWVAETGLDPRGSWARRLKALAARPDCELHLHLLASTAAERRAIVDDLWDELGRSA